MNITLPPQLSYEAATMAQTLLDARRHELTALAGMTDEQMYGLQMRIIEPPIWELGHVGWFQENWILQNLDQAQPIWSDANDLYNSFNIPNEERWALAFPKQAWTMTYITAVLQQCIQRLAGREVTAADRYFYALAVNHEDMHSETMIHIRQTLGYTRPPFVHACPPPPVDEDFDLHDVAIPGGTFMVGATPELPFVFDNEKWAHPQEVAPFHIAATPVTTAQYQAFVAAGGYQAREYWSEEGWAWRESAKAEHPIYWQREADGSWRRRSFTEWFPLQPFEPMVHVNFYEANAYCAWAGRRLPTEGEWEVAASGKPSADGSTFTTTKRLYPWGNDCPTPDKANLDVAQPGPIDVRALPAGDSAFGCRQMIGNVWEWTADTFNPYPGYVIDPYATYSYPSFGQQKVLRGGCWTTRGRVIRNTWRNFYTPDRNNIFAGFRTCAL